MNSRTVAAVAVGAVVIVLLSSYAGLARDDGRTYTGEPWTVSCLEGNLPGHRPSPADDLYAWANYGWLRDSVIPEGMTMHTEQLEMVTDTASRIVSAIDRDGDTREDRVLGTFLSLIEDVEKREALGNQPLRKWIDEVESIGTTEDMIDYIVHGDHLCRFDFTLQHMRSEDGGTVLMLYFRSPVGTYPGIDFVETMTTVLDTCGVPDPAAKAEAVHRFITSDDDESGSGWPLDEILEDMGLDPEETGLRAPSFMNRLGHLLHNDLDTLKAYIEACYCAFALPYLDQRSSEVYSDALGLFDTNSSFVPYGDGLTCHLLKKAAPSITASLYADRCFDPVLRESLRDITGSIVGTFGSMIAECQWVDEHTRSAALEKLDRMLFNIAEVTWARDMEPGEFSTENLLEYASDCLGFEQYLYLATADRPYDPTSANPEYIIEPNMCNVQTRNTVIVGGPLAEHLMGDGSIESILGGTAFHMAHEVSHGFDPTGGQYDSFGWMSDGWWTPESLNGFLDRLLAIADRLSTYEPAPGIHLNGDVLAREEVAEVCAMTCILRMAEGIDGFDYAGFFEAFAGGLKMKFDQEGMDLLLSADVHPLSCYRVNFLVQNFREFHDAFGVKEGDGMWLPPEDYLRVW